MDVDILEIKNGVIYMMPWLLSNLWLVGFYLRDRGWWMRGTSSRVKVRKRDHAAARRMIENGRAAMIEAA